MLTRREFLKVAGAGAAGAALLGSPVVAGCSSYLPEGGSRMNVVLVIADSLRKDHVGAYGNDWIKTPNLDALAGESLRFTRAYPESMPTILARRAIHTGIRTFPFRNWDPPGKTPGKDYVNLWGWQPIPEGQTTLAEILRDEGYSTLFVTDTLHQFRPFYNFHRGFSVFHFVRGQERDFFRPKSPESEKKMEKALIGGPNASHAEEIMRQYFANTLGRETEADWFTPQVFGRAIEFLDIVAQEGQPFFMVVDNYDPHEPWDPPGEYVSLYDEGYEGPEPLIASSGRSDWLTERQLKRMRALYSAEVTMMDRWLGRFLDRMGELGMMENTLLIFLSDHGHAFGEHGFAGKVPSAIYPELTDVPFFIRHPQGRGAGKTSDFRASTHDVAPTILGAIGREIPEAMEGRNLSPLLEGGRIEERPYFTAGYNNYVWARDDRYAMIARYDGSGARLYDLREDPGQQEDVAPDRPDVVKSMFNDYVLKDAGGPLPSY